MEINEAQTLIKNLYFHYDTRRGLKKTLKWFLSEVEEFIEAVEEGDRKDIMEEAADVFAWLLSILNILEISLEEAFRYKYPGYCIKCGYNPCRCEFRDGS